VLPIILIHISIYIVVYMLAVNRIACPGMVKLVSAFDDKSLESCRTKGGKRRKYCATKVADSAPSALNVAPVELIFQWM